MVKRVEGAADFYRGLAKSLDGARVDPAKLGEIQDVVESLSPEAPLTLQIIDGLGLSAGLRANLIFAWLNHRYPDQIEEQLPVAQSIAGVLRALVDGGQPPAFLQEFYVRLTHTPAYGGAAEIHALADLLEKGQPRYVGERDGRVVFQASVGADLRAHFPDQLREQEVTLVASPDGGGGFQLRPEGGKSLAALKGEPAQLGELPPGALAGLVAALKAGAQRGGLAQVGKALRTELGRAAEGYEAPVHPVEARLDQLLRLTLGNQRVGETRLESLNQLIEQSLAAAELAMQSPGAVQVLLSAAKSVEALEVPEDGYQASGLSLPKLKERPAPANKASAKASTPEPEEAPKASADPLKPTDPSPDPTSPSGNQGGDADIGGGGGWANATGNPRMITRRPRGRSVTLPDDLDLAALKALVALLRRHPRA
ncbi:MAG: hypothetical protein IPG45_01855 [Deltaproteobacteria bacterium]|jgi:hypothetical protein|nr:hypothetical protein [Deltaproteobacteria bacterium]